MAKSTARHLAAKKNNNIARNAGVAAIAGAAIIGSVAPANAFAMAPATTAPVATTTPTLTSYATTTSTTPSYSTASSSYTTYNAVVENTTTVAPQAPAAIPTGTRGGVVNAAMAGQGVPYVWGGETAAGWDCSGFVANVFARQGINLTSYTKSMMNEVVPTSNPQPGDIVFTNGYNHVGIYLGDGKMISALNPGQGTLVTAVDGGGLMPVDGYYTVRGL